MARKPRVQPGERYGQLTVLRQDDRPGERFYVVVCDCGAERVVKGANLRTGNTTSCGGHRRPGGKRTHGLSRTPTWFSWQSMRRRCSDPADTNWRYYGGRGIRVCDRWQSFENFLADMGERSEGMTLDRIDVDADYSPDNCRWATALEQRANQRRTDAKEPVHAG